MERLPTADEIKLEELENARKAWCVEIRKTEHAILLQKLRVLVAAKRTATVDIVIYDSDRGAVDIRLCITTDELRNALADLGKYETPAVGEEFLP